MPSTTFCFEPQYARRAERMKASEIRELLKLLGRLGIISFAGGIPDPALFPASGSKIRGVGWREEGARPAPHGASHAVDDAEEAAFGIAVSAARSDLRPFGKWARRKELRQTRAARPEGIRLSCASVSHFRE